MNAIQDLIQSAWVENESAIQKEKAGEESAKARMAAKGQADAAWGRAHEKMRPYPKIDPIVRVSIAGAALSFWALWVISPDSIIGGSGGLGVALHSYRTGCLHWVYLDLNPHGYLPSPLPKRVLRQGKDSPRHRRYVIHSVRRP